MRQFLIKHLPSRLVQFVVLCKNRFYYSSPSYFPEYGNRRKTKSRIFCDQVRLIIKNGWPEKFYFMYGFDIKGFRNVDDYIPTKQHVRVRNQLNHLKPESPTAVLRDKFLFGVVAKGLGIPTPNNIGIIENGLVDLVGKNQTISVGDFFAENPLLDAFLKVIDGECAEGVYHLVQSKDGLFLGKDKISVDTIFKMSLKNRYLLQESISQHHAISAIFPKAINTIRFVTIYNKKENRVEFIPPLLRVGTGDNKVDNWAAGGLAIGIDVDNECLKKYGFYKPMYGTKTHKHPDSGVVFDGYPIPFIKETIAYSTRFHYQLRDIHSIGWDVALTPNGPCFIEGNDNWEISLMQICSHGLNDGFKRLFLNK